MGCACSKKLISPKRKKETRKKQNTNKEDKNDVREDSRDWNGIRGKEGGSQKMIFSKMPSYSSSSKIGSVNKSRKLIKKGVSSRKVSMEGEVVPIKEKIKVLKLSEVEAQKVIKPPQTSTRNTIRMQNSLKGVDVETQDAKFSNFGFSENLLNSPKTEHKETNKESQKQNRSSLRNPDTGKSNTRRRNKLTSPEAATEDQPVIKVTNTAKNHTKNKLNEMHKPTLPKIEEHLSSLRPEMDRLQKSFSGEPEASEQQKNSTGREESVYSSLQGVERMEDSERPSSPSIESSISLHPSKDDSLPENEPCRQIENQVSLSPIREGGVRKKRSCVVKRSNVVSDLNQKMNLSCFSHNQKKPSQRKIVSIGGIKVNCSLSRDSRPRFGSRNTPIECGIDLQDRKFLFDKNGEILEKSEDGDDDAPLNRFQSSQNVPKIKKNRFGFRKSMTMNSSRKKPKQSRFALQRGNKVSEVSRISSKCNFELSSQIMKSKRSGLPRGFKISELINKPLKRVNSNTLTQHLSRKSKMSQKKESESGLTNSAMGHHNSIVPSRKSVNSKPGLSEVDGNRQSAENANKKSLFKRRPNGGASGIEIGNEHAMMVYRTTSRSTKLVKFNKKAENEISKKKPVTSRQERRKRKPTILVNNQNYQLAVERVMNDQKSQKPQETPTFKKPIKKPKRSPSRLSQINIEHIATRKSEFRSRISPNLSQLQEIDPKQFHSRVAINTPTLPQFINQAPIAYQGHHPGFQRSMQNLQIPQNSQNIPKMDMSFHAGQNARRNNNSPIQRPGTANNMVLGAVIKVPPRHSVLMGSNQKFDRSVAGRVGGSNHQFSSKNSVNTSSKVSPVLHENRKKFNSSQKGNMNNSAKNRVRGVALASKSSVFERFSHKELKNDQKNFEQFGSFLSSSVSSDSNSSSSREAMTDSSSSSEECLNEFFQKMEKEKSPKNVKNNEVSQFHPRRSQHQEYKRLFKKSKGRKTQKMGKKKSCVILDPKLENMILNGGKEIRCVKKVAGSPDKKSNSRKRGNSGDNIFDDFRDLEGYKPLILLGMGSFACVRKAQCLEDSKFYGVKKISKAKIILINKQHSAKNQFDIKKEIKIHQKMNHPNLLKLHKHVETDKNHYLVMDYVQGGALCSKKFWKKLSRRLAYESSPDNSYCIRKPSGKSVELKRGVSGEKNDLKKIPLKFVKSIFKQMVEGIYEMHVNMNVAHRDIKPDNILVDNDLTVKICDFGVSEDFGDADDKTTQRVGTVAFQSPELLNGDGVFSAKACDIWALGCTLYYMVLGYYPFKLSNKMKMMETIKAANVDYPEDLPKDLVTLLKNCLQKCPETRYDIKELKESPFLKE